MSYAADIGFLDHLFPCLPQCRPFACWIALAEDHFSRRVMGYALFRKEPASSQVRAMLGRAIAAAGKAHVSSSQSVGITYKP